MIASAMTSPAPLSVAAPMHDIAADVDIGSPALALWEALASAHASVVARLDPTTDDCAVIGTDAIAVLLPLSLAPDHRLRMHELADRSHLTRSGLTRRVDRLVADGLVEREHCADDGRGAYARLTDNGGRELAMALPHHVSVVERYLGARLSPEEVANLTRLLGRL
jgi:DNA-binding MarR family transcriptional regulator